ncbi:MAG: glycosyltransferase family 39 protein [Clostridia bacterium]|nr:glycosyltransferase family 39 protein [Clostridia bacterium]
MKCKLRRFLFACLASYGVLAVCSKSSFLYPMNDWVDVNCFFTVGRGILHGLVPYRDLYEQKGPLIYFLFALAGRISESSFLGVYLLEGLCFAFFLYLSGRIAELLSGRKSVFGLTAAALAVLIPLTPAFSHGSSAEEFFLPVLSLGLLLVLQALHHKKPLTNRQGFVLGLCTAAALWTKYTFCGLFAGLALGVLLFYLLTGKARRLPALIGSCLLGFLSLSAAVVGWFALKGALPDLWQAYFVNNLARYSSNIQGGHYAAPLPNLLNNLGWSVPGLLGLLFLAVRMRKNPWEALAAWAGAVCLFVFTYWNGRRYPYYALVLAVFAPLGFAALASAAARIAGAVKAPRPVVLSAAARVLAVLLLAAGIPAGLHLSPNAWLMKVRREEMPQYQFAEIIRQSGDATLLNYGFLDGGFYFAAGVLPSEPYFCSLNIDLEEMRKAQQESLRQGKTQYVVIRGKRLKNSGAYRLVCEADQVYEGRNWHYCLYALASPSS